MKYLAIVVLLIATSVRAHAYIDAGSGSYMLQMSMAGILAVVYVIKLSWQRLKSAAIRIFSGTGRMGTNTGA